jgi:hypothetical protein
MQALIAEHPKASRRALSLLVCEAWNWMQPNGAPRDMVCRGLMLALHRAGHIELPAPRWVQSNPSKRLTPALVLIDRSPIRGALSDLGPLELVQVRRSGAAEAVFDGLIEEHHYLGYRSPVGEHLKFLLYAEDRPVACFAWSSSIVRLGPRDRFVGWSAAARKKNIRYVTYNSRFLIVPWVRVPHLASHALGRMTRELSAAWERVYDHPIYLCETYVDRERFAGTCYRAANWICVGQTTGRGKDSPSKRPTRSKKDVLVQPLSRRFRERLRRES